ncbi:hypothetical protein RV10_GL001140 [Enterococcus pallens]|nr:hypothetical protein RV10_GL001140 [Enterococcus pallens]
MEGDRLYWPVSFFVGLLLLASQFSCKTQQPNVAISFTHAMTG